VENSIRKACLTPEFQLHRVEPLWRYRVRRVARGESHLALSATPKVFMHLVPVSEEVFTLDKNNQQTVETVRALPLLFRRNPYYYRINIDGFFGYIKSEKPDATITSYRQLFWDGSIEYADTSWLDSRHTNEESIEPIPLSHFEYEIVTCLKSSIVILKQLHVPLPIQIHVALIGLRDYRAMASRYNRPENYLFDRDEFFFQSVVISDWEDKPELVARPIFDQIWNAGGYLRSFSYDANGDWKPDLR